MIDIENIVINTVATALKTAYSTTYPNMEIKGESVDVPAAFPCITIEETANRTLQRTQDESLTEHQAIVNYTVNVFVNNVSNKKAIAKKIANTVDQTMQNMKFTRTLRIPTPNVDRSIYRLTMRYEAIVGQPKKIDGKDRYPMYRR